MDAVSAVGAALGRINGHHRFQVPRSRAQAVYVNLTGAAPDEAAAAMDRLFDNTGRLMIEFSLLDRLWPAGRITVEGSEHLRAAREAGRPVIVMGLHVNNWEVIGPSLVGLGLRFKFIYQPPRSRFDHKIAVMTRTRYGAILLQPGVVAARIARRLLVEEKGVLLIFADDERNGYVNAPLFDRPVNPRSNLVTIARLAAASGAAVIPAYAERTAGARFKVIYLPPVELADGDDALSTNVERLDRIITPPVLANLDRWYMLLEQ